jgi:hypothetical protein
VYARAEFVTTLQFPVVSTLELFNWWREGDWDAIRVAILGQLGPESEEALAQGDSFPPDSPGPAPRAGDAARGAGRFRRRRR